MWYSVWLNLMLQGFSQMLARSIPSTWAGLPKDHQRPATGSKQTEDEVPHCSNIATGICLWDTWLVCDQFTYSRHHWLSDHSSKKILPLCEMRRAFGLFPYSLLQNRIEAFLGATRLYSIQPELYRKLRYLLMHLLLLLTAHSMQFPEK